MQYIAAQSLDHCRIAIRCEVDRVHLQTQFGGDEFEQVGLAAKVQDARAGLEPGKAQAIVNAPVLVEMDIAIACRPRDGAQPLDGGIESMLCPGAMRHAGRLGPLPVRASAWPGWPDRSVMMEMAGSNLFEPQTTSFD